MAYPNTFLDIQRKVQSKLRLDANVDAATGIDLQAIKDTINEVYADAVVETEADQGAATAVLTPGVAVYTVPVRRIKSIVAQAVGQSSYGPPLTEVQFEQILEWRQGEVGTTTTGTVTHYTIRGLFQMDFWPTPATADTLLFYYASRPEGLNDDTDIPILGEPYSSKVLEYGALAEMCDFLLGNEHPRTQAYRSMYAQWMGKLRVQMVRVGGGHTRQLRVVGANGAYTPNDRSADVRC